MFKDAGHPVGRLYRAIRDSRQEPTRQENHPQPTRPLQDRLRHWAIVIVVFGITGFVSLQFSRLVLNNVLQLEGGLLSGPWSYRAAYLVIVPPFYSITLVAIGSLLGKHTYFKRRVTRMWGRLLVWRPRA